MPALSEAPTVLFTPVFKADRPFLFSLGENTQGGALLPLGIIMRYKLFCSRGKPQGANLISS
jgi:hypothetical protein